MQKESAQSADLKEYYVYELVDTRSDEVFYVGKGVGTRGNQHELEAQRSDGETDKLARIQDVRQAQGDILVRVIGRYSTEEQAYAAEATLIHWVYGLDNLTNVQGGHGGATIRSHGVIGELEGIDIPKRQRQPDGVYTQAMREARDSNGIIAFLQEIKKWLEEELDVGFSEPDTAESNKTKIYSYFEVARLRIGVAHSGNPFLWLAVEPADNTKVAQERFVALCSSDELEMTNKSRKLARFKNYHGTRDLAVLLQDVRRMIRIIENC